MTKVGKMLVGHVLCTAVADDSASVTEADTVVLLTQVGLTSTFTLCVQPAVQFTRHNPALQPAVQLTRPTPARLHSMYNQQYSSLDTHCKATTLQAV